MQSQHRDAMMMSGPAVQPFYFPQTTYAGPAGPYYPPTVAPMATPLNMGMNMNMNMNTTPMYGQRAPHQGRGGGGGGGGGKGATKQRHVAQNHKGELCMTVVDPATRKLLIPLPFIYPSRAQQRTTLPSLCQLFLHNRCHQGTNCYQVHASWDVVQALRAEVDSLPCCCVYHGDKDVAGVTGGGDDTNSSSSNNNNSDNINSSGGRTLRDVVLYVPGCAAYPNGLVPLERVSYTQGLRHLLREQDPLHQPNPQTAIVSVDGQGQSLGEGVSKIVLDGTGATVCRLHATDRCRYAEECKFLHLCKDITNADRHLTDADHSQRAHANRPPHQQQHHSNSNNNNNGNGAGHTSSAFAPENNTNSTSAFLSSNNNNNNNNNNAKRENVTPVKPTVLSSASSEGVTTANSAAAATQRPPTNNINNNNNNSNFNINILPIRSGSADNSLSGDSPMPQQHGQDLAPGADSFGANFSGTPVTPPPALFVLHTGGNSSSSTTHPNNNNNNMNMNGISSGTYHDTYAAAASAAGGGGGGAGASSVGDHTPPRQMSLDNNNNAVCNAYGENSLLAASEPAYELGSNYGLPQSFQMPQSSSLTNNTQTTNWGSSSYTNPNNNNNSIGAAHSNTAHSHNNNIHINNNSNNIMLHSDSNANSASAAAQSSSLGTGGRPAGRRRVPLLVPLGVDATAGQSNNNTNGNNINNSSAGGGPNGGYATSPQSLPTAANNFHVSVTRTNQVNSHHQVINNNNNNNNNNNTSGMANAKSPSSCSSFNNHHSPGDNSPLLGGSVPSSFDGTGSRKRTYQHNPYYAGPTGSLLSDSSQ